MNDQKNDMNPLIKQAIENNFYGLNAEDFFIQKILMPIKQSRYTTKISNKVSDRNLLRAYFDSVAEKLIPTKNMLLHMEFISHSKNSDLAAETNTYLYKIFSAKFLLWTIENCNADLAKILSFGLTKHINNKHYDIHEVIDNLSIVKNENNKQILLSEILLTKDLPSYSELKKSLKLTDEQEKNLIENLLKTNNDSILLHRKQIKDIIVQTINYKQYNLFDSQIRILSVNKLDFLLDILLEAKNEATLDKDKDNFTTAIYKLIDKALYTKKEELIDRVLEVKKEQPRITGIDIYALMTKRFYSYMKKEVAQQYFKKLIKVAKANGEFNEVKKILFSNIDKYPIKSLSMDINFQDSYLNKEMKTHFMNYLAEKMPEKNSTTKPMKI